MERGSCVYALCPGDCECGQVGPGAGTRSGPGNPANRGPCTELKNQLTQLVADPTKKRGTDGEVLTMSSREIAKLVESRHDNAKRTIERLADKQVIDIPPTEEYLDSLNGKATEYCLDKRSSFIVVVQHSPKFNVRVVYRWQELGARVTQTGIQLPDFTLPAIAVRVWADQYERALLAEK